MKLRLDIGLKELKSDGSMEGFLREGEQWLTYMTIRKYALIDGGIAH